MLDSCGNKQHELQQLDYPPRTKLNRWALLLLSSLPLWNSCHPLNLPTCLSSPSPSPSSPFSLGALSCLFWSEGISWFKVEIHRLPQHAFTATGISLVLDPALEPAVSLTWRRCHPSRGCGLQEAFPFSWRLSQGHSEAAETPCGLFMHSFNKHLKCWENSLYNRVFALGRPGGSQEDGH